MFDDIEDDSILEHLDADNPGRSRFPLVLSELNALLREELRKRGYDPSHALPMVAAISKHFGGVQFYMPRGKSLEYLLRDMRIWQEYDGHNVVELARKYHVAHNTIYKAVARMRFIERQKHQLNLF